MAAPEERPRWELTSQELWEKLKPLAREMRHKPTPAEKALWQHLRLLRLRGLKFRRQHAIGPFIVDFYCVRATLVIEVDGPIHERTGEEDTFRDACLQQLGLTVLRVTNDQVLDDPVAATARIEALALRLAESYRSPPLLEGEGAGG